MSNIHTFSDRDRIEQEAREWLIRLDSDTEPSAEEVRALRAWVARSPAHRQELLRISAFWNDANILTELSIPLETTTQSIASRLRRFFAPLMSVNRYSALAASLLLAVTIGAVSLVVMQPSDATNGIYVTAIGDIQERKLVDGSILKINTDSQVQVDYSDNVRKIRLLRGEAHFQVSHNANWPFEVYAGTRMVKAIGTAFSVQLSNDSVQVTVSEGRVDIAAAVAKQQQLEKVGSLSYGQKGTFANRVLTPEETPTQAKNEDHAIAEITTLPKQELNRRLAWREGYLVFDGEPLSHVVAEINRYLPTTIEIDDPAISEIKIGGRFKVGQLDAMFDVLETSFGIEVSRLDDQRIQLRQQH